jgi:ABC-type xylose transport system permease subunit
MQEGTKRLIGILVALGAEIARQSGIEIGNTEEISNSVFVIGGLLFALYGHFSARRKAKKAAQAEKAEQQDKKA